MSRRCAKCPTSHMRNGARHLHELEPGQSFRFVGSDGTPFRLVEVSEASCKITSGPVTRTRVIKPRFGEPRMFQHTTSGVRSCAGSAMVVPIEVAR